MAVFSEKRNVLDLHVLSDNSKRKPIKVIIQMRLNDTTHKMLSNQLALLFLELINPE